jgi:hypothetical protein
MPASFVLRDNPLDEPTSYLYDVKTLRKCDFDKLMATFLNIWQS